MQRQRSQRRIFAWSKRCIRAPLLFRFATLYGISPRTRFDLIVNQFVLEAFTKRELIIYQRGYSRSFVHIRDVARGVIMGLEADNENSRAGFQSRNR